MNYTVIYLCFEFTFFKFKTSFSVAKGGLKQTLFGNLLFYKICCRFKARSSDFNDFYWLVLRSTTSCAGVLPITLRCFFCWVFQNGVKVVCFNAPEHWERTTWSKRLQFSMVKPLNPCILNSLLNSCNFFSSFHYFWVGDKNFEIPCTFVLALGLDLLVVSFNFNRFYLRLHWVEFRNGNPILWVWVNSHSCS